MPVPLVLLPGMNCSPRLWDGVRKDLGAGRSGGPARPVVVLEVDRPTLGEQVESLLDRLPRRFAIGGLSLGAIVAMAVHRRAPERVAGLFLVATNAQPPTEAQRVGVGGAARFPGWRSLATGPPGGAAAAPHRARPGAGPGHPGPGAGRRRRRVDSAGPARAPVDPRRRTTGARRSNRSLHRRRGRRRTASARSNGIARSTNSSEDRSFSSSRALPTWWRCRTRTRWPRPLRRGYSGWTADRSAAGATRAVCRGGGREVGEHAHEHLRDVVDHEPPARREDPSGVLRTPGELGAP